MRSPLAALLLSILVSTAASADPQLVKDIRLTGVQSSSPRNFVSDGTTAYFIADDGQNPTALWKTDGTEEGTRLLKMPYFDGFAYSQPWLTISGSTVYFFATADLGLNIELWRSDGTVEGTIPLAKVGDQFNNRVTSVAAVGPGRLAFIIEGGKTQVWVSDGTPSGTRTTAPADALPFVGDGTVAYFLAGPSAARELWRTDGTATGTRSLGPLAPATSFLSIVAGKALLATRVASGSDLSVFDGNATTTIGHVDDGSFTNGMTGPDRLLFVMFSEASGRQLWTTDGTAAGTRFLTKLPATLFAGGTVGGLSFFITFPQSGIRQLWRTDGTVAGTFVLSEDPNGLLPLGSGSRHQYFLKTTGDPGVWITDGTIAGTQRISATLPRFDLPSPSTILSDDTLLFAGSDAGQVELWRSDGTASSTRRLVNIADDTSSLPSGFASTGELLLFHAFDTEHGMELWRSDGTAGGTALVRDIRPGTASSSPETPVSIGGGVALFVAEDGTHGRELWRTDGTTEGTRQVREIHPTGDAFSRFPAIDYRPTIVALNGIAYFRATQGSSAAAALWRSDGTEEGTFALKAGGQYPTIYDSAVVFSSPTGLWRTDGTLAGTTQFSTAVGLPTVVGSKLFVLGAAVSVLDSPSATARTVLMARSPREGAIGVAVNGLFLFSVDDEDARRVELWRSDGTVAGTRLLRDIYPGARGSIVTSISTQPFSVLGSNLYFTADDGVHGAELWSTDGTEAGTRMVADLAAGATDSLPNDFAVGGGRLWFSAYDFEHGRELWSLQGAELTRYDISRGPASSGAGGMFPFAGAMWFHASTPETGSELWKIQTAAPPRRRAADVK
jgi:ELWxxDGT repeat protein